MIKFQLCFDDSGCVSVEPWNQETCEAVVKWCLLHGRRVTIRSEDDAKSSKPFEVFNHFQEIPDALQAQEVQAPSEVHDLHNEQPVGREYIE